MKTPQISRSKLLKRLVSLQRKIERLEELANELAEDVGDEIVVLRAEIAEFSKKKKSPN